MPLADPLARVAHLLRAVPCLAADAARLLVLATMPFAELAARVLLAEKQLAMFKEREVKPRRARPAERVAIALLTRLVADWRDHLVVVTPDTVCRWHRRLASWLWWRRSHRSGRPPLPCEIRAVIARIAADCPTWSPRRIRDGARLKLGVKVAEATVRKYLGFDTGRPRDPRQRWTTFIRNHADQLVATDLFTVWTAGFRTLYVLVAMHVGTRRILHVNVTSGAHSAWVEQQLREAVPTGHGWRFLLHDRDAVFTRHVDDMAAGLGLRVLRSPPRVPQANAFVERLIGTLRRECLDHLIVLDERHLRKVLAEYAEHYNRGRPHMSLGPGIPDPAEGLPVAPSSARHALPAGYAVVGRQVLNGLHHEYRLDKIAA